MQQQHNTLSLLFILSSCFAMASLQAQTTPIEIPQEEQISPLTDKTQDSAIHTIQFYPKGLFTGDPVIQLGDAGGQLTLAFDDLSGGVDQYWYTFVHCDKDWYPDQLNVNDYLDGFDRNQISQYDLSFGTAQRYTHYSIDFPNDDVRFLLSGNYVVFVWRDSDEEVPVFSRRFIVWEQGAFIQAKVQRPNLAQYRNEYQEVDFTADISGLEVNSVFGEMSATILQNGRFDNALTHVQPRMVTNSMLTYDSDQQVFPGAKEYRRFSTETLKFQSDRIVKIERRDNSYHAYVNAEESRVYERYVTDNDANGTYVIMANLANRVELEADYAWVYFTLKYPYVITSGDVYVSGQGLPDNKVRMTYDYDKMQYTARAYLKQGYYNYLYGVWDASKGMDYTYTEGNSYQTENDYTIILYQHMIDLNYDRIIGYQVVSSVK